MSRLVISEYQNIVSIAEAIRSKTGETKNFTIGEMIDSINNFSESSDSNESSFIYGNITTSSDEIYITIPDIIGKDNVLVTYLGNTNITSQAACMSSVYFQGSYCINSTSYNNEFFTTDEHGIISYDKNTGTIELLGYYNEAFRAGKYMYVAW